MEKNQALVNTSAQTVISSSNLMIIQINYHHAQDATTANMKNIEHKKVLDFHKWNLNL